MFKEANIVLVSAKKEYHKGLVIADNVMYENEEELLLHDSETAFYLYITNNDPIKERDWVIDEIGYVHQIYSVNRSDISHFRKILLTDNPNQDILQIKDFFMRTFYLDFMDCVNNEKEMVIDSLLLGKYLSFHWNANLIGIIPYETTL